MARGYNFSAGPSMLPEAVLVKAASEMLDYNGSGQSVMEMSHRSKTYDAIIKECEALLREIMQIPDNYKVLFLQGGASSQFAMIPLNLMNKNGKADFIITGQWANKAYQEAARYGDARAVASSKDKTFSYIPKTTAADFRQDADYVHICMNNTIYGTKFKELPDTGDVPLIADISSCVLSEPIDVSKFAMLYAGAQKNMAPAGLTVVIIREDLMGNSLPCTPTMLDYKTQADGESMYNTPPCYAIYVAGLVYEWLLSTGGLAARKEINEKKAAVRSASLDSQSFYKAGSDKKNRSLMNATFVTGDDELDKKFCAEAAKAGLVSLKGHRSVGGMRASIYNAMPMEGVEQLVQFMEKFEKENK